MAIIARMKQGQSISLSQMQTLRMTPQLQQLIRLLALTTQELDLECQKIVEENPFLEIEDEYSSQANEPTEKEPNETYDQAAEPEPLDYSEAPTNGEAFDHVDAGANDHAEADFDGSGDLQDTIHSADEQVGSADDFDELQENWQDGDIPGELPVDASWDEVYQPTGLAQPEESGSFETGGSDSLHDHLLFQLNLARLSSEDRAIGEAIIDALDTNGYLTVPADELASSLKVELDEFNAVLHLIQHFDPVGVGARDAVGALILQLEQLPKDTDWRKEAIALLKDHADLMAAKNFALLARRLGVEVNDLQHVLALIQTLNPRPGNAIDQSAVEYVVPEIIVRKYRNRWQVELNPETAPRIRLVPEYANFLQRNRRKSEACENGAPATQTKAPANDKMRDKLQEARWFLKGLQHRSLTLLRVATEIVDLQQAFLENGPEHLRPLVLRDIAQRIEVHEATVSRVTKGKYMHTPRGIFELKYFFSAQIARDDGGNAVANKAIQERIRKLVGEEGPQHPLSDNEIAKLLKKEGFVVARRTVAKYREQMRIPPSNERRQLVRS